MTPWEWLSEAQDAAQDALRGDDAEAQKAALADLQEAKRACGLLGCLLVTTALELGPLELQKKLQKVFGGLARQAWQRALAAEEAAAKALQELDSLRVRLRELERALVDRTAGVGRAV